MAKRTAIEGRHLCRTADLISCCSATNFQFVRMCPNEGVHRGFNCCRRCHILACPAYARQAGQLRSQCYPNIGKAAPWHVQVSKISSHAAPSGHVEERRPALPRQHHKAPPPREGGSAPWKVSQEAAHSSSPAEPRPACGRSSCLWEGSCGRWCHRSHCGSGTAHQRRGAASPCSPGHPPPSLWQCTISDV